MRPTPPIAIQGSAASSPMLPLTIRYLLPRRRPGRSERVDAVSVLSTALHSSSRVECPRETNAHNHHGLFARISDFAAVPGRAAATEVAMRLQHRLFASLTHHSELR